MIIEDAELRDLFRVESEEQLQSLDEGLLRLEKDPQDGGTLEEVFRNAHSLKGASRMLGVSEVERLAHRFEDLLGAAKRGEAILSPDTIDRLYAALDAIRALVHEAITGAPADVDVEGVLAQLHDGDRSPGGGEEGASGAPLHPHEAVTDAGASAENPAAGGTLFTVGEGGEFPAWDAAWAPNPRGAETPEPPDLPDLAFPEVTEVRDAGVAGNPASTRPNGPAERHAPEGEAPSAGTHLLPEGALTPAEATFDEPFEGSGPAEAERPEHALSPVPSKMEEAPPRGRASAPLAGRAIEVVRPGAPRLASRGKTPGKTASAPARESSAQTQTGTYRIETIRVEPTKLDALMTQAGELTVTKRRIARRLSDIEEIMAFWEEWNRDAFTHRSLFTDVERAARKGALKNLATFHERGRDRLERLGTLLNDLQQAAYEDNARLDFVSTELVERIRAVRLLPFSTIFNLFPRMVRDLAREEDKEVRLIVEGGDIAADKRILEDMKDPLMHMVRNSIDHGIEPPEARERLGKPRTATLSLKAKQTATNIVIEVVDDGRGLDVTAIKEAAIRRGLHREEELASMTPAQIQALIFAPGFSTRPIVTDVSGRGVGMDVVHTNVEHLKGSVQVESEPGRGCTVRVHLPLTLATARVLLASLRNRIYAVPVEFVQTTRLVSKSDIYSIQGRQTITIDDRPVSIARLAHLLELEEQTTGSSSASDGPSPSDQTLFPSIILSVGEEKLGLLVDDLLDEQEVVLKPHSALLKRVRNISGATTLGTGELCMVLQPHDLMKSVCKRASHISSHEAAEEPPRKLVILLCEDSLTTRTQEKRILEGAGFEVVAAVDGLDGYNKLQTQAFDAVVSDVEMPKMDGLSLTAKIRQDKRYAELPVVLVTSLSSEEDKKRGIEVGANAYITKATLDQKILVETLRRFI